MESPIILPNGIPMIYPSPQGVLKLAATNIIFGAHKDDQGIERSGWTAALSMMIGEKRETLKAFHVYPGKAVLFNAFVVKVLGIESSRMGMVVMAEISAAK